MSDVSVCPDPFTPTTFGVAETNSMLPTSTPEITMEVVAETVPAVAVTTDIPAKLFAVNVAVAMPETVVAVGVIDPSVVLSTLNVTVVPSGTLAVVLSVTVAVTVAVPNEDTPAGATARVIVAGGEEVVIVVPPVVPEAGPVPVGTASVTEVSEQPTRLRKEINTIRASKR